MARTKILLKSLESIAYDDDDSDVMHSLEVIRSEIARDTTEVVVSKHPQDWTIRSAARSLLTTASKFARDRRGKLAIMDVAAYQMGQVREDGEENFECQFVVRAAQKNGRSVLELVGPVDASPRFLCAYAFWLIATKESTSIWLKLKRKRCPVCKKWFPDNSLGRPRRYCSTKCHGKRYTL